MYWCLKRFDAFQLSSKISHRRLGINLSWQQCHSTAAQFKCVKILLWVRSAVSKCTVSWEWQPRGTSHELTLKQTQCVVLTCLVLSNSTDCTHTHRNSHNKNPSSWCSDFLRWKPPSVTHRSHNLSWHQSTALPMERYRFTQASAGQGSRLPLSFRVIQTKQWRGSRKAPCGMVNNQREWQEEMEKDSERQKQREGEEVRQRLRETNPLWQCYIEDQVQNMIIWGQVNFTNIQSFTKNLTLLEWKICQIHDVQRKNTHAKKFKLSRHIRNYSCNNTWWKDIQ